MPDLDQLGGEVRQLIARFKAGGTDAFAGFRELISLLLHLTVMSEPKGGIRLIYGPGERERAVLGGRRGPDDPLPLNDGCYLRISVSIYLAPPAENRFLKVEKSSFQYQNDFEGKQWILRYDYLRYPPDPYPAAHLQLRGSLEEQCLPAELPLDRVHFPTGRVSLEAIIRLLADQFRVPCNSPVNVWRPILAASERAFLEIAHRSLSGPEQ